MNSELPLLSIIIPTHNRSKYAIYAIRSILQFNQNGIELVVSDTSTDDLLKNLVDEIDTKLSKVHFKYTKHSVRLDMTENHDYALSQATGEYVCLIGDDDSVSDELYNAAEWAKKQNINILTPKVTAMYNWPDFQTKVFGNKHCTRLYLPKTIGGIEKKDTKSALVNALNNSCQGTDGLPKLYHGLVKNDLLKKLNDKTGAFFHGSSPDMSAAIGLALIADSFHEIDYPLTIPGASGGSNTGRSAMNKHKGSLSSESQTNAFTKSGWNNLIPLFFSVETVWSHAALNTLEKLSPNRIQDYNFINLYSLCEANHSDYYAEIADSEKLYREKYGMSATSFKLKLINYKVKNLLLRGAYIAKRILIPTAAGGKEFVSGVLDVSKTPELLNAHLSKKGFNLATVFSNYREQ
ncbi:glycosyltransferase family 2 protein [Pseudoalteromonas sp. ND6B]|uniref:glycosyltransferase family 2 protein n=1 Tax=Pseudoalteromonas sp. ND6B TaxID=1535421 RepID=UPI00051D9206|nr:glycosyltransferase [Pseudoalteromonas sp. ND6B]KGJ99255.1 glycosyl transferase family 2 [Pseudoalteromonas sp. ND6B]